MGSPPAIDALCAAGNAAGGCATEIGHELCDLLRLKEATDGPLNHHDLFDHLGLWNAMDTRLVGYLLLDECRAHIRRTDGVTGHTMFGSFQGCHSRQSKETVFGGDIRRLKRGGA